MDEDTGVSIDYSQMAHEARMVVTDQLHDAGCTCHPYLSVAIVENVYDELVAHVQVNGHEPCCRLLLTGREN